MCIRDRAYLSALPAGASEWEKPGDMAIGRPDAPITVIEYFSLTCPHCKSFHTDVYPKIKEHYVDTGTVRMILRDFPLNRPAMDAALLARCKGSQQYFAFIDTLFNTFDNWTRSSDYLGALIQIGQIGGIKEAEFHTCKADEEMETRILSSMVEADETYSIQGTPTFIINGKKFKDKRGHFRELLKEKKVGKKFPFVVASFSKKNVIRGLHIQLKNSQ